MNPPATNKRPQTLLPPPGVYAAGLALGWFLQQHFPWSFQLPHLLRACVWGILGFGILLIAWAVLTLWRHRTTVNPYGSASRLVTAGPFAFSRNPIYLADMLLYFAISSLMQSGWPFLFIPAVWVIMRYAVIAHEEKHLLTVFGTEYSNYCLCVERWLGKSTQKNKHTK